MTLLLPRSIFRLLLSFVQEPEDLISLSQTSVAHQREVWVWLDQSDQTGSRNLGRVRREAICRTPLDPGETFTKSFTATLYHESLLSFWEYNRVKPTFVRAQKALNHVRFTKDAQRFSLTLELGEKGLVQSLRNQLGCDNRWVGLVFLDSVVIPDGIVEECDGNFVLESNGWQLCAFRPVCSDPLLRETTFRCTFLPLPMMYFSDPKVSCRLTLNDTRSRVVKANLCVLGGDNLSFPGLQAADSFLLRTLDGNWLGAGDGVLYKVK